MRHTTPVMDTPVQHLDSPAPLPTAAVVGLGRFGAFWARFLAPQFAVVGTGRRIVEGCDAAIVQQPLPRALRGARFVFLTVTISALPEVLDRIAPLLSPGTVVVDTCSVKVFPVREMRARLPDTVDIIACHPMFGPDSARARVGGLPVITHPVRDAGRHYTDLLSRFTRLGMRVVEMSPDDHDREAAFTQGVTHLVGRVLDRMGLTESAIATLGYQRLLEVREQTRNDPLTLFRDLQRLNPYTREMRRAFSAALGDTEALLESAPGDP